MKKLILGLMAGFALSAQAAVTVSNVSAAIARRFRGRAVCRSRFRFV